MVALSITQDVKERNMDEIKIEHKGRVDYYKWDEDGYIYVSRGWRSWGCVTAISSYLTTLVVMIMYAIAGLIAAIPFIVLALIVGLGTYLILGGIR
jgi:hypothetical protein